MQGCTMNKVQFLFPRFKSRSQRWVAFLLTFLLSWGLCVGIGAPVQAFPLGSSLSDSEDVQLGRQINAQLLKDGMKLYKDPEIEQYVKQIGQRLVAKSTRSSLPFTFQVVNDKSVNAFATTGGFVYIQTGLMLAAENEAQLASVMAHEIGHIEGKHLMKSIRRSTFISILAQVAGVEDSPFAQIGAELALRKNSRKHEKEADDLGLQSLTRSGFAPAGMLEFMQKLEKMQGGGSPPAFLSTHPNPERRVERLQEQVNPTLAYQGDGLDATSYQQRIQKLRR